MNSVIWNVVAIILKDGGNIKVLLQVSKRHKRNHEGSSYKSENYTSIIGYLNLEGAKYDSVNYFPWQQCNSMYNQKGNNSTHGFNIVN